jgi:hypothetical protein
MLFSSWLLAASVALAYAIACKSSRLEFLERVAIAVPLGLAIGTWVALAASLVLQQTSWISTSVASALLTIATALLLAGQKIPSIKSLKETANEHRGLIVLLAIGAVGFGLLLSTHVLEEKDGATYSAGSTWGDLAIHLSFINSFVRGQNALPSANFPSDPTYSGARLSYPFLPDYNAAALIASGASLRAAIIAPSLLLFLALIALLYFLALRFSGKKEVALVAVAVAIFAGGIGFLQFPADLASSSYGLPEFLVHLSHDYVHSSGTGHDYYWLSLVNDIILPQRSALFAFPLSIAVFLLLWTGLDANSPDKRNAFALAGVCAGLLPFLQGHAFIAVGIVSVAAALLTAKKPFQKQFSDWLYFFAPAAVLGGPQMLWFAGQASAWGFARFSPVWQNAEPFSFWFANLGLFAVLSLAGIAFLNRKQGVFYAGFLAVFLAASLLSFQPWPQDNTKLFYQWVFAAAIVASLAAFRIGERVSGAIGKGGLGKLVGAATVAVIVIALIASGALAVLRESSLHYQFHSANDIAIGEWIAANTPKDAIILTSDWHAQPAATIAGRPLVMGYRGWLWSHGYDYGQREKDVRLMLTGGLNAIELLGKYHVSYAVIGPSELRDYSADKPFFNSHYTRVYSAGGYVVYKIS